MYYLALVINFEYITIRNPFILLLSQFWKAQKCRNLTLINIEYAYLLMLHNHRQLYIIINVCSALSLSGSKNESNVHASIHRVIGIRCFCCCHGNSWNRLPGEKTNQISVWVENNHICICTYKFREKVDPGSNEKLIVPPPPQKKCYWYVYEIKESIFLIQRKN